MILLHLILALAYSRLVPLGEAPDEPAHLAYARFIARTGRLPVTLEEREAAGYRSAWPPLYHTLVAAPLALVGDKPPDRLKSVGDTPRRLIPTDGQTIAAFIHTADEAWPWRGLPLAWHLGRLVSVLLTAAAVAVTYAVAWQVTGRADLAAGAAAIHAFLPQMLFIGSTLNDDNLLVLLSGLVLLTLARYSQNVKRLGLRHAFFLGALLGLASAAKYNALPLWGVVVVWGGGLVVGRLEGWRVGGLEDWKENSEESAGVAGRRFYNLRRLFYILLAMAALIGGAALTAGWWFIFVWRRFNRVEALGLLPGSLAALTAGARDAALRRLAGGVSASLPPVSAWLEWGTTLFETFWGSFGGSGVIDLPGWIYALLALVCLLALAGVIGHLAITGIFGSIPNPKPQTMNPEPQTLNPEPRTPNSLPSLLFILVTPLFFLPLPIVRFILSGGRIVETAQGRHLFPAISAISLGLVLGLWAIGRYLSEVAARADSWPRSQYASRFTPHVSRLAFHASRLSFYVLLFLLSLYSLTLIHASYPPPIPLWTTPGAAITKNQVEAEMAESVTLVGYDLEQVAGNVLPVTLVWRAEAVPARDYLVELAVVNGEGRRVGGWLGHPLGGRYPTRAWDEGDLLRHTVPVTLLPGLPAGQGRLTVRLVGEESPDSLVLAEELALPAIPALPANPAQLRADDLQAGASFTYRSTLSFAWPGRHTSGTELIRPDGRSVSPDMLLSGRQGSVAHFIVGADWPTGSYRVSARAPQVTVLVINRLRQFEPPSMAHRVEANFAGYLTLLGYDLPRRRVQPGSSFPITLHWRAEQTIGRNLTIFNHLLDRQGRQRGGVDRIPQNYYTTFLWVPGEIVSDAYQVPVNESTPPGVYWLDVGLYPSDQPSVSLPLLVDGQIIDRNSVSIGPIKVGGAPPGVTITARPDAAHPVDILFGGQIRLLGFDLVKAGQPQTGEPENASAGSGEAPARTLRLFWQAEAIPDADYTVFVHLLDQRGNLVSQADGPPANGLYPTSLWEAGEIIIDERALRDLPPGQYTVWAGLYRPDTGERLPVAGQPDGAMELTTFEVN